MLISIIFHRIKKKINISDASSTDKIIGQSNRKNYQIYDEQHYKFKVNLCFSYETRNSRIKKRKSFI